eukprot:Pgem_evm1s2057
MSNTTTSCVLKKDAGQIVLNLFASYGSHAFQTLFLIQLILVLYGYLRVGKGYYWHVLMAAAAAGSIGIFMEELINQIVDVPDDCPADVVLPKEWQYVYIIAIFAEFCWITLEFSIVVLNYIKLAVFLDDKKRKIAKFNLFTLFVLNVIAAFLAITAFAAGYSPTFSSLIQVFNAVKSAFPLILAFDAILIKALNLESINSRSYSNSVSQSGTHKNKSKSAFAAKGSRGSMACNGKNTANNNSGVTSLECVSDVILIHESEGVFMHDKVYDGSDDGIYQ